MYAEAFGLREEPFAPTPDPAYLVLTPDHREALAALEYGLRQRRGFISLIGEVGTGKTTLLYTLMRRIAGDVDTAFFSHTTLGFEDLLWAMLRDLGVAPESAGKRELIAALDAHLHRQADAGRTTALIIDEAQNLSVETLEELRLLSNFETFRHKLLQIVLVGQPELEATLAQPRVRQLRDRIAVRATLRPLPRALVPEYISHRLAIGGLAGSELFRSDAMDAIARLSAGVPRRINALCHGALLNAYARRDTQVGRVAVRAAARELGFDQHARHPPRSVAAGGGQRWQVPLPGRGIVAAAGLATLTLVGALNGVGSFGAEAATPAHAAAAGARVPEVPPVSRSGGEVGTMAGAAGDSLFDLLDWLIPSAGYQEWHRMHRPRSGSWADRGGAG
jgi:general secretion pathway protein A